MKSHIGTQIKNLRKSKNMTQEQLAELLGISFQAVSKWENNITLPDITLVPTLAKVFGVSTDTIFAYNAKGDTDSAVSALEQIPEIYFTKLAEMASILDGQAKFQ